MTKTYFISDLHLGEETPTINAAFFAFLESLERQASSVDALFILGDFFEVWIGDDNQTPLSLEVADRLKQLSHKGIKLFFIHGNRDFLIKKRYAKQCAMTILPEQAVINLYGTATLLCHGDELCTDDVEYQAFRKKNRTWWWQTLMLNLPLSFRRKKAAQIQARSKMAKQQKSLDIMDVNEQAVARFFKQHQVSQMIHGHTHRPKVHQYNNQLTRFVLGDWYQSLWFIEASKDDIKLVEQPLQQ